MEADLAKLADLIIIIVESAGTLTELGAFSLSPALRQKLLAVVDERYEGNESFIGNGPLRWIDKESNFSPTIYAELRSILSSVDQIEERIQRIAKPASVKIADLSTSPKHLLFFIVDLVSVIYPATLEMITYYLNAIAPSILTSEINIPTLVALAVAMDLLRTATWKDDDGSEVYFAPADPTTVTRPFHHSRLLYLEGKRASGTRLCTADYSSGETSSHSRRKGCMIAQAMSADLGLPTKYIWNFAQGASHAYKTYYIEKAGGVRTIHHPSKQLKAMQRWLNSAVIAKLPVHPAAADYRENRSIFDNASVHAQSKYLLRMDCKNFFPSITERDIRLLIEARPAIFSDWDKYDVELFCNLVCRDQRLAIGAPSSPGLSNAICFDMDAQLADLSGKEGVTYTRYADDLFFSTLRPNVL